MPHAGLMSTQDSFESGEGALLRARLHIRGAKRRLRQGKISAGIVTLYDAFLFALRWYLSSPERRKKLSLRPEDDVSDEEKAYALLQRARIVPEKFDYSAFDVLVEKASQEEMPDYDYSSMLRDYEALMHCLGVMPFNESDLPPEDPSTF
jgi:hypothetical protein